jgi:hypothetical protein
VVATLSITDQAGSLKMVVKIVSTERAKFDEIERLMNHELSPDGPLSGDIL